MARCPFSCGLVFRVEIFSSALLSSSVKALWENFFFSPVKMIVDSCLPTLFIS